MHLFSYFSSNNFTLTRLYVILAAAVNRNMSITGVLFHYVDSLFNSSINCVFPLQKRNGMMDPDDFRACLISMGYDLVSSKRTFLP